MVDHFILFPPPPARKSPPLVVGVVVVFFLYDFFNPLLLLFFSSKSSCRSAQRHTISSRQRLETVVCVTVVGDAAVARKPFFFTSAERIRLFFFRCLS